MTDGFAERVRGALTADLEGRERWDEPPALLLMRDRPARIVVGPVSIVPDELWAAAPRVPDALDALAKLAEMMTGRELRRQFGQVPGLCGLAFRHEGWVVRYTPDAPAAFRRQADADARAHRLHARPDRVECRMIEAATLGGQFFAGQMRGGEPMAADKMTGRVSESLLTIWRPIERALRERP
jgi:hypothetical protein